MKHKVTYSIENATKGDFVSALCRGLEVLKLLSLNKGGLPFGVIKSLMNGVAASTLSRLLKALLDDGMIKKNNDSHYCVGNGFLELAKLAVGDACVEDIIEPVLANLGERTKMSAAFAVYAEKPTEGRNDDAFFFTLKKEQPDSIHYIDIGQLNFNTGNQAFGITCSAYQRLESQKNASRFCNSWEEFEKTTTQLKNDAFLYYENGVLMRFVSPVFLGENGLFAGAMGVSCSKKELSGEERRTIKFDVMKYATEATNLLNNNKN